MKIDQVMTSILTGVIVAILTTLINVLIFSGLKPPVVPGRIPDLKVGVISLTNTNNRKPYEEDLKAFLQESGFDADVDIFELSPNTSSDERGKVTTEFNESIKAKKWDVVFSILPRSAFQAYDSKYEFVAKMFFRDPRDPQQPGVFFVRSDSTINQFQDITERKQQPTSNPNRETREFMETVLPNLPGCGRASTSQDEVFENPRKALPIIAFGKPDSPDSMFTLEFPFYHLYGATFFADYGNSPCEILKKVLRGEAHVGVGIPALPIITQARSANLIRIIEPQYEAKLVPYSGVFLSSELQHADREAVKKALYSIPEKLAQDLHYAPSANQPPDYEGFRKVNSRIEKIMTCADWQRDSKEERERAVSLVLERSCNPV